MLRLKEYYSLLEIRQWLLEKEMAEKCGTNKTLILYFYSNDKQMCKECEEQGYILSYSRKNYDEVNIYSFDIGSRNPAVSTIKRIYDVRNVPTVIINNNKIEGFVPKETIVGIIEQHISNSTNSGTKE